uniref:Putative nucleolar protein 10 n=1 Tax=Xenopsylla cheopis TaxID=163159 RepID=A0A6M2DIP1_XENCH
MHVSEIDNVKIYNLSTGKSLPEWLSLRKRKTLLKKNVDIRRRIELIQDFDMPGVSTTVKLSPDGQYILATGIYKPRVKCFDVNNLSLKFERCFDSEVITFEVLSDDYSKLVFLQCDRFVEIHVAHGRHYRLRIPNFGRDLSYHKPSCNLFLVGASSNIFRLDLERGQFLQPYATNSNSINCSVINPEHHLLCVGTAGGTVEAWDPRSRERCSTLDCALNLHNNAETFPAVTSMAFKNGLTMGVGTASGHVLLYDIRSSQPLLIKDHMNGLPINNVVFHNTTDHVYSMDSSVLKIWMASSGKQYTAIESNSDLNSLCVVPNSGLFFMANEDTKMLTYYIPSLGPAPHWCSFLDTLTEELQSQVTQDIYDDYKFVTLEELKVLDLEHLIGTPLLRAYMHGYFIDIRLYRKAKSVADPFEFAEYRKRKIHEKIEQSRPNRLQIKNLPTVNKEFAIKLMNNQNNKKKSQASEFLLNDDRFSAMFKDPDFEIDKNTEEFRLLNPVLSKLSKDNMKAMQKSVMSQFEIVEEDDEKQESSDDLLSEYSSDDEHQWTKEVKMEYRKIQNENRKQTTELEGEIDSKKNFSKDPKLYQLKSGEEYTINKAFRSKSNKKSLGDRIREESADFKTLGSLGRREMTFSTYKKKDAKTLENMKKHRDERRKVIRPTTSIHTKKKFW